MAELIINSGDRVTYTSRWNSECSGLALRLEPEGWRVIHRNRQYVVPVDQITAVKRGPKVRPYRLRALELDPGCRADGPKFVGHYRTYSVYDSKGVEIGYTDGNEGDVRYAWARAYATLQKAAAAAPATAEA